MTHRKTPPVPLPTAWRYNEIRRHIRPQKNATERNALYYICRKEMKPPAVPFIYFYSYFYSKTFIREDTPGIIIISRYGVFFRAGKSRSDMLLYSSAERGGMQWRDIIYL